MQVEIIDTSNVIGIETQDLALKESCLIEEKWKDVLNDIFKMHHKEPKGWIIV